MADVGGRGIMKGVLKEWHFTRHEGWVVVIQAKQANEFPRQRDQHIQNVWVRQELGLFEDS